MKTEWTPETLQAFEQGIADTFNAGKIKAPIHLSGGNEKALIQIFDKIKPNDWVCSAWRSHYHCLLKNVPADELKQAIVEGCSIALCFPKQRVISSALVAGIIPVALGLAWAAKRSGNTEQVWTFIGDMTATSGLASECVRYARGHGLPLKVVVENNFKSVSTDTMESWGACPRDWLADIEYTYELKPWPHVGSGRWIHMQ